MITAAHHLLSLAMAGGLLLAARQHTAAPALPYESWGVCPFECCTYRTWSVTVDTDLLTERRDGAPVAFRAPRGAKVRALTGVVITTRLGRAVVKRPTAVGREILRSGDQLPVLHELGEEYWMLWVGGRPAQEEVLNTRDFDGRVGARPCLGPICIVAEPRTVWWVKIRRRGRVGWTREVGHFDGMDACG